MDSSRWQQVSLLFERALATDDIDARALLLTQAASQDPDLAAEVRSLLEAHSASETFLEDSALGDASLVLGEQLGAARLGRQIGCWQLDALIHQGGMGSVYRAHRVTGSFTQTAALKLIRLGLETPELIRRFSRERQILASLQHPYIARLLDGGTTDEGLPWLAMEYVEGIPVDRWCDLQRLDIGARIQLFCKICSAVQHAHQQLVIHRDLKPANILITEEGVPRLLDFGIAKLLADDGDDSEITQTRHRALTPSIASPEQFSGGPITTATDVYALGVLLYRLLAGCAPFLRSAGTSAQQFEQWVRENTPTRPSQAAVRATDAAEVARARSSQPPRLRRALQGDLDTIVMKALRKEPERRYPTASALADDLQRHLDGLPVQARPDAAAYRAQKFVGRHWKGLLATSTAFAGLGAGLLVALWQTDAARLERDRAQQINAFLETILLEADPYEAGADTTVRDVLRKASELVTERFAGEPALEAGLRQTIGYTQLGLMELPSARANLERSHQLHRTLYGTDDERTLRSEASLAWVAFRAGRLQEAEQGYRSALERLHDSHSLELQSMLLNDYAVILDDLERHAEALPLHRRVLKLWLKHEPENPKVATARNNIASSLHGLGEFAAAEKSYREAIALRRSYREDGMDPDLAIALNNLAVLLRDTGRSQEAVPLYRESLAIRESALGKEHAFTGYGHLNLGRGLLDSGDHEAALPHLREALRISRSALTEDHLQTLVARASLARALQLDGDVQTARDELIETIARMEAAAVPAQFLEQARGWLLD